ncbi:maleylpyruvate isomerase N-terminal domain-containing protein [Mycolicibacterium goodii]|uniref:Mycothiol maleylpyruvate isomerase N-terminal domain protein n=1 Tax=Mycolicibacterium goodii TaxID=134601 RepID=A0A0K0X581_MYCGD|nr:mycothiol maleylpyruvate isomerase N-terminal domain protein [Mycolicibacterium goodii]
MTAEVFASAAAAFARLVRALATFDGPGLGDWDLRALVGHTSRSLVTVSTYVHTPAETADLADAVDYYAAVREHLAGADAAGVIERGVQAGLALGDDPAGEVDRLVAQALSDIDGVGDPIIKVFGGHGIRLSDYLDTRIFELAVHSLDISRATGVPAGLPADVLSSATLLAASTAARFGDGEALLLALTGRAPLPDGYSVV